MSLNSKGRHELFSSQNRAGGFNCQEQGHGVEFQGPHHGV